MESAVAKAVDTYIRLFNERDPAVRASMIEACWSPEGRLVTRSREFRGRGGLAELADRSLADPNLVRVGATAIDASGTTFRFRGFSELRDGTRLEVFDAGEIDDEGRIRLLLTFKGAL
jgi:hypothetical protein